MYFAARHVRIGRVRNDIAVALYLTLPPARSAMRVCDCEGELR